MSLDLPCPYYSKVTVLFGSHVYGTNTPESDLDYKTIYIPRGDDILLQRVKDTMNLGTKKDPRAKNQKDDIDHNVYSLQRYMELLLEGQTEALEILFTPDPFIQGVKPDWWKYLQEDKDHFIHKGTAQFAEYCKGQADKYGIKGSRVAAFRAVLDVLSAHAYQPSMRVEELLPIWLELSVSIPFVKVLDIEQKVPTAGTGETVRKTMPHLEVAGKKIPFNSTIKHSLPQVQKWFSEYGDRALQAEKNEGIDWKACMHAIRVGRQAKELLLTGSITLPRPDAAELLAIRRGHAEGGPAYPEVSALIEEGLAGLVEAALQSKLPAEPNRDFSDYWVEYLYHTACQVYMGAVE